jgi:hypothetical protein
MKYAFTATKSDEILLGDQPHQLKAEDQHF